MMFDAVIIGGGAIGLSAAWHLAQAGARVRLIEKRALGAGASGCSASLLEFQVDTDRDPDLFRLARLSRAMFPVLEAEIRRVTGEGFGLEERGILHVALSEAEAASLRAKVARHQAQGLRAGWMEAAEVSAVLPQLRAAGFGAALFSEDGQISGESYMRALAAAARRAGVHVTEDAGDVTLERLDGAVVARSARLGDIRGGRYVVAAGAWTSAVLRPLGVELPITPVRGQLNVHDAPAPDLDRPVYTSEGGYIAPKRSHMLVGSTVEQVGFDDGVTAAARDALMRRAERLLTLAPPLRGTTAGLRPATPDLLPIIGFLPRESQVLIAAGHYRNGMLLSPITGRLVRDLLLDRPLPLDLSPFRPERFLGAPTER